MVSLKTSQIHIVLGDDKTIIRSALKEDLKVLKVLFLANWLAHNKKVTKKFVFRETWSPEMTSQSFPVSCFWSRGFVSHRKWNLTLYGEGNSLSKKLFAVFISTLGRFNRANKKYSVIYTWMIELFATRNVTSPFLKRSDRAVGNRLRTAPVSIKNSVSI